MVQTREAMTGVDMRGEYRTVSDNPVISSGDTDPVITSATSSKLWRVLVTRAFKEVNIFTLSAHQKHINNSF